MSPAPYLEVKAWLSVLEAFRVEAERLAAVMLGLDEADFDRPTGCAPWTVRELLAHVRTGTGRLTPMLTQAPPPGRHAEVNAAGYYQPARFAADEDAERVAAAQRTAARVACGHELAQGFDRTWRYVSQLLGDEPPDRVVLTRHGDAMRLDDFVVTRVVELGVHGLDLAAALGRPPWLSGAAARVIADLLVGVGGAEVLQELGWDRLTFITKATGRAELTIVERAVVDRRGIRWLALG